MTSRERGSIMTTCSLMVICERRMCNCEFVLVNTLDHTLPIVLLVNPIIRTLSGGSG